MCRRLQNMDLSGFRFIIAKLPNMEEAPAQSDLGVIKVAMDKDHIVVFASPRLLCARAETQTPSMGRVRGRPAHP